MKYVYVYPSNWNRLKFTLRPGDAMVHKGAVPEYVERLAAAVGVALVEAGSFPLADNIGDVDFSTVLMSEPVRKTDPDTGETVLEAEPLFDEMWSQSWDDVEDFKVLYVEGNDTNVVTTRAMMKQYVRRSLVRTWVSLGYEVRLLLWRHQFGRLSEWQAEMLSEGCGAEIDIKDFDPGFPWYRVSIAGDATDGDTSARICHIVSKNPGKDIIPVYRRVFLNKYLTAKYGDDIVTNKYVGKFDKMIISQPFDVFPVARQVIFDRSDNWSGVNENNREMDETVMRAADKIICSSRWLYRDTEEWLRKNRPDDGVRLYYVPNGNVMFPYPERVEKFSRKTAIYIGQNIGKLDMTTLSLLCRTHPEWDFMLYGQGATELRSLPQNLFVHEPVTQEEIFPVLCRCHCGLILLNGTAWTVGMLSNKLFSYINARIPTVYSGVPAVNYADYEGKVAFELGKLQGLDGLPDVDGGTFAAFERDWSQVVREIDEIVSD